MRKFLPLLLTIFIISGCASSEKLLQSGNYDQSIGRAFKKLTKNPNDQEEIGVLKKSFRLANQNDLDAIKQLKYSNAPGSQPVIYRHYLMLDQRQKKVERLPNTVLNRIGFTYIDYSMVLAKSKKNTALYYHNEALRLMGTGNRFDARNAYSYLIKEKNLFPQTEGIDKEIAQAMYAGTTFVLFETDNNTGTELPPYFFTELAKIKPSILNSRWIHMDFQPVKNRNYYYTFKFSVMGIRPFPERINRQSFVEKKRMENGWKYVLDSRGNVKKDSLGNDIKVKKFKNISCKVTKIEMIKKLNVLAHAGIYDNANNRILKGQNIESQYIFRYTYGKYRGNQKALHKKMLELVSRRPVHFPGYDKLLYGNIPELREKINFFLKQNRNLFR